ncbi:MAG: hypothetical protein MJ135_01690 [Oscillospiraceae bacterium]|nr:hypothetical protein [Oscillospiraceae bacterium]
MSKLSIYVIIFIAAALIVIGLLEIIRKKCYFQNYSIHQENELEKFSLYDGAVQIAIGIAIILVAATPKIGNWASWVAIVICPVAMYIHARNKKKILVTKRSAKKSQARKK